MKLKSYLRGLGLGMVVTTIILVIAFRARNHEMSDWEIISRAHELGMVETSLYADTGTENNALDSDAAINSGNTTAETTMGEESGEGKTEPEITTAAPEETTGQEPTTAKKPENTTAAPKETTGQEPTTAKKPENTTAAPEETTGQEPTTAKKPENTTAAKEEIVVVFEDISSADKASRILYEAGVIQDIDSFNEYLSENGYARKISEGEFTFTTGMSFEEIARIITRSR